MTQVINRAGSTVKLASNANPARPGQAITLTATVTVSPPGAGTPTGTVTFYDGSASIGAVPVNSAGNASLVVSTLTVGTHSLSASYGGDSSFLASVSSTLAEEVVTQIQTSTTLAVSPNPAAFGQAVTLTATVAENGTGLPTGFVTFYDGASTLGTVVLDSSGHAHLSTSTLGAGSDQLRASYGGDTLFAGSTSSTVAETVTTVTTLAFTSYPRSTSAGVATKAISVQILSNGSPVAAGVGGLPITLTSSSATGTFLDSTSKTQIASLTIPAGSTGASFLYMDKVSGSVVLTATPAPVSGTLGASQSESIVPGPIDHLILNPGTVTLGLGSLQSYSADGLDVYGNVTGNVTASSAFGVDQNGSCSANSCSVSTTGPHHVTATDGNASGSATIIGDVLPVPNLTEVGGTGTTPRTVTFTGTAADPSGLPLTYTIDFGDGSRKGSPSPLPPGGVTLTHTYTSACLSCVVVFSVSDGIANPGPSASATVNIQLAAPLSADAGDPVTIDLGLPAHLGGSASTPASAISSYHWDFGDGTSANGAVQNHTYTTAGDYTATLTVTGNGQMNSATTVVHVLPPTPAGLAVTVASGPSPVTGATVGVEDSTNNLYYGKDEGNGSYLISGLPDGSYTVFAYKAGYLPASMNASVVNGKGTAAVNLQTGSIGTTGLTSRPLSPSEASALGIDINAPGNQTVDSFALHLAFAGTSIPVSGVIDGNGWYSWAAGGTGGGGGASGSTISFPCVGCSSPTQIVATTNGQDIIWMIIPGQAKWLKELFDVTLAVTNLAPAPFTFSGGSGTLTLPTGVSLADTLGAPQQLTQSVPQVVGGGTQQVSWVVRGDQEGYYNLRADYGAALEPLGVPLHLTAQTVTPLHVWGASALHMTFVVDDHAYASYPYHVVVEVQNVADVPVYNVAVTLQPLENDPSRNYIFQPDEQYTQSTSEIKPGATFDTQPYIVAPNFNGTLLLDKSFVLDAGGPQQIPHDIADVAAPLPSSYPTATFEDLQGETFLRWQPVPGALSYQVFTSPNYLTDFPQGAIAQVWPSQPGQPPATSVTLPLVIPGSDLVAIGTSVMGTDGQVHIEMLHPLAQFVASQSTLTYTGPQSVVTGTDFMPSGLLQDASASCVGGREIDVSLASNPITGLAGQYPLTTEVTNSSGVAGGPTVPTPGWRKGTYTLHLSAPANATCSPAVANAQLTVTPGVVYPSPINAIVGKTYMNTVALVRIPSTPPASITINWGDNTTSSGTASPVYASEGLYQITASHTYCGGTTQCTGSQRAINQSLQGTFTVTVNVSPLLGSVSGSGTLEVDPQRPEAYYRTIPVSPSDNEFTLFWPRPAAAGQVPINKWDWNFLDSPFHVIDSSQNDANVILVVTGLASNPGGSPEGSCPLSIPQLVSQLYPRGSVGSLLTDYTNQGYHVFGPSWRECAVVLGILPLDQGGGPLGIGGMNDQEITGLAVQWLKYFPQHVIPHWFDAHGNVGVGLTISGAGHWSSPYQQNLTINHNYCGPLLGEPFFGPFAYGVCDIADAALTYYSIYHNPRLPDYWSAELSISAGRILAGTAAVDVTVIPSLISTDPAHAYMIGIRAGAGVGVGASVGLGLVAGWFASPDPTQKPSDPEDIYNLVNSFDWVQSGGGQWGPVSLGFSHTYSPSSLSEGWEVGGSAVLTLATGGGLSFGSGGLDASFLPLGASCSEPIINASPLLQSYLSKIPWTNPGYTAAKLTSALAAAGLDLPTAVANLVSNCNPTSGPSNPFNQGS